MRLLRVSDATSDWTSACRMQQPFTAHPIRYGQQQIWTRSSAGDWDKRFDARVRRALASAACIYTPQAVANKGGTACVHHAFLWHDLRKERGREMQALLVREHATPRHTPCNVKTAILSRPLHEPLTSQCYRKHNTFCKNSPAARAS